MLYEKVSRKYILSQDVNNLILFEAGAPISSLYVEFKYVKHKITVTQTSYIFFLCFGRRGGEAAQPFALS